MFVVPVRRVALALALFATLLLGMLFTGVGAASAHEQLNSSSPASAEKLALAPSEITLVYTDVIMDIGAAIMVTDSAGTDWATGAPLLRRDTATMSLDPAMPDGHYEVAWRVVSGDGHPISGLIPFTVGEVAADAAPEAAVTDPSPPADEAAAVETYPVEAVSSSDNALLRTVFIGAGGAALALGIAWIFSRWQRRHTAQR